MSTPRYTPGPWFVYPTYPDRFVVGNHAPSLTGRVTADCSPKPCITGNGDETMSDEECAANARLIAAAPDLLAACLRVLAELEDGITMGCEEDLREAVAKAEGRSE